MERVIIQPLSFPKWNVEEELGYKPITTFWQDFSIAEKFGAASVKDTFKRAFAEWKGDYKYLTELVMVLNHKIWQHYDPEKERQSPLAVFTMTFGSKPTGGPAKTSRAKNWITSTRHSTNNEKE